MARAGYVAGAVADWRRLGAYLSANGALPLAVGEADGELAGLAELLCLGRPLPAARARHLLAPLRLEDLERFGLLAVRGDEVVGNYALVPHAGLLLAGDFRLSVGPDAVSPVNNASITLARLTPREPRRSMLDLGTGSGIQALLAAGHCRAVTAVDINPRALMFTEFNARLNRVENIRPRRGSWFAPVVDRRFDLIVANPPYVVSPDHEFTYRDSGLPGSQLVEQLCRDAAAHLDPDGVFVMLACWPHASADDWPSAPTAWAASTGCHAVVIRYEEVEPLTYALNWNRPPARFVDPGQLRETVGRWLRYYETLGATKISFGAVVLRRGTRGKPWPATLEASAAPGERAGEQLTRVLAGQDSGALDDRDMLATVFSLPPGTGIRQRFQRGEKRFTARPAMVSLEEGLGINAAVDPDALDVLFACDGRRTLSELVTHVAQRRGESVETIARLATGAVRELLAHGLLES